MAEVKFNYAICQYYFYKIAKESTVGKLSQHIDSTENSTIDKQRDSHYLTKSVALQLES